MPTVAWIAGMGTKKVDATIVSGGGLFPLKGVPQDPSPRRMTVVTSVLMGAKRMDQLKDNLAAIHLKLTQDELKSLDEASQLPPEYPEWMLATQGADRLGPVDLRSKSVNQ
jgi:hypothetical protein